MPGGHREPALAPAPATLAAVPEAPEPRAAPMPLDRVLARAVLQRREEEKSWWDSIVDTVGDAIESVGSKLEQAWELSDYPAVEQPPPKPGPATWAASKGLTAIRAGKGLLSKSKVPRGDKAAAPLLKAAVHAWGAETFGRDLLPKAGAGGKFDAEAAAAVRQVQLFYDLTADGVVGPKTLAALDGYVARGTEEAAVDEADVDPRTVPIVDGFSADEELWITQVWAMPEIRALFGLYPTIPRQILTRVDKIVYRKDGSLTSSQGIQREGGEEVEIADNTYNQPESWDADDSAEAQFKTVLIHELFHVFQYWNDDVDLGGLKITTPGKLVGDMIDVRYGWFIHPTSDRWDPDAQKECHFSWGALDAEETDYFLPLYSPLRTARSNRSGWEASPDSRGAEEDVATCLGWYLGSDNSHDHLQDTYPWRYELIDEYVGQLRAGAEGRL